MTVLKGYFDASGTETDRSSGPITIGGYVATESQWRAFERGWQGVLKHYGVSAYSAADSSHFRRDFAREKGWNEERRESFRADLIEVKRRTELRGFATAVRFRDFDSVNLAYRLQEDLGGPYAVAAAMVVAKSRRSFEIQAETVDHLVFFFEKGDHGQGDLRRLLSREFYGGQEPQFLRKRWIEEEVEHFLRPFEAGDFLAYEMRKAILNRDEDREHRPIIRALDGIVELDKGLLDIPTLTANCEKSSISRRSTWRA